MRIDQATYMSLTMSLELFNKMIRRFVSIHLLFLS